VNAANILLARAAVRQREMAIRAAVGAGRWRLIRQMLTQTLLLALLGGVTGAVLGKWTISASGSFLHSVTTTPNFGYRMDCSFDWKVFAYTLAAAVLAGMFVGVWPAFRASHADVNTVLHERGRSDAIEEGHHSRGILVVAQLAGSLTLLVVAGLFVRSLSRAENMFLGFNPKQVLTVLIDPHQAGYDQTRTKTFYRELKARVRALPGVQFASFATSVPMEIPARGSSTYVEIHPLAPGQQPPDISSNSVDPPYFQTMGVPLLQGRSFTDSDDDTARLVAVVNQAMVTKLWPGEDPIGKRFSVKSATGPFIEVIGVAADGQYMFVSPEHQPYFYLPLAQHYSSFRSLQIRSSVPPESLIPAVQQVIRKVEPDLPLIDVRTMDQVVRGLGGLFIFRLAASLAAVMGFLGLALAAVGVYGVVSFSVTRRTQEIGIRMALGANRDDILKLVSRQGLRLVIAGVVVGVVFACILTRAIGKLLMGVSVTDPATYTLVVVLLSAVTLLAGSIPARRATRVDPMKSLRTE
jgi:putative ABC transport system permease protein